jgi:uncharacterized protein YdiU (UPF0061 family)
VPEIVFDHSYAGLPDEFFARVAPAEVPKPALIQLNLSLAAEIGLDADWLSSAEGVAMLSGNALPATANPIAMVYAGHQFGGFTPQLGDGRAILLGELVGADGVRRDVQLKGSGRTPFSRGGDGKAPLGPVIREYLVSEAMAALGIPTTRALAAVTTGEWVQRDEAVPGAVLTRVAQSHVRVGTFEFFASRGQTDLLRKLADYIIDRHYPEARGAANPVRALLEGVVRRQAHLIARWMHVGFVHGVMNTDNTQIAGETIDFGPCAFMEKFDVRTVFSSIDRTGRYAFGNQPSIGHWNLSRLAESLLPLLADNETAAIEAAKAALEGFSAVYNTAFVDGFCRKLGLALPARSNPETDAAAFINETFALMTREAVDFTLFFRHLTLVADGRDAETFLSLFADRRAGEKWLEGWRTAAAPDRVGSMRLSNPIFIPRNHRVEEAIQAALRGDYSPFERLNRVLARPFDEQPEHAKFESPPEPSEIVEHTFCGT